MITFPVVDDDVPQNNRKRLDVKPQKDLTNEGKLTELKHNLQLNENVMLGETNDSTCQF